MEDHKSEKIMASVGILTLNSEATLARALESVKEFDDIIVCDGNSTDRTLEIARSYGARIVPQFETAVPNQKISDFSKVRNTALAAARHQWFLYIDSDESLSSELKEDIRLITKDTSEKATVFRIPNKIIYRGRVIDYATSYPGYQTRFFNTKSGGRFIKSVHERLEYGKENIVRTLHNPWYVYIDDTDYNDFWRDIRTYVPIEVERSREQTFMQFIRWSIIDKVFRLCKVFFKALWMYLCHGFSKTLPPKFEFQRFAYTTYLMFALIRARILRQ